MATLNNTQISTTYVGLLKTSDNGDLTGNADASAVNVTDGIGTATQLYMSKNRVGIGDSTPTSVLSVKATSSPQLALKYDDSNTASLSVTSGGDLNINSSGGKITILDTLQLTGYSGGAGGGITNAAGQLVLSFSGVNQELVLGGAVTSPATVKGEGLNISDDAIFSATTGSFGSNGNGYELFLYSDTSNRYVQWVDANARLQFKDNTELTLGDGNDLTVVHNGSKTSITNTTGDLELVNSGGEIHLMNNTRIATSLVVEPSAYANITLDYAGPHLGISMHAKDDAGWARGMHFLRKSDNALLGGIGGIGGADALTGLWIGASYDAPQLEVQPGNNMVKIFHDATLVAGKKLYFDDAGHTYLTESYNDILQMVVGTKIMASFAEAIDIISFYSSQININDNAADTPYMILKNDNNNDKQSIFIDGSGYASDTLQLGRDDAGHSITLSGDTTMPATKKLFFDGTTNTSGGTYITESSANVMKFYADGTNCLTLGNDSVDVETSQLSFTSDSGTEIYFSNDNIANITSGGKMAFRSGSGDTDANDTIVFGTAGQQNEICMKSGWLGIGTLTPSTPLAVVESPHNQGQIVAYDPGTDAYHQAFGTFICSAKTNAISVGGYAEVEIGNMTGILNVWISTADRVTYNVYGYHGGGVSFGEMWKTGMSNYPIAETGSNKRFRITNNGSDVRAVMMFFIGSTPGKLKVINVT